MCQCDHRIVDHTNLWAIAVHQNHAPLLCELSDSLCRQLNVLALDVSFQRLAAFEQRIAAHNLKMKLVDAEYTLDRSKLVFYFTADNRVDFRELVQDLASQFHTRIELRQSGGRDES